MPANLTASLINNILAENASNWGALSSAVMILHRVFAGCVVPNSRGPVQGDVKNGAQHIMGTSSSLTKTSLHGRLAGQ